MPSRPHRRGDPWQRRIEAVLRSGTYVAEQECGSFVAELAAVERELVELARTEPDRAATLYEVLIAGCYEKAEDVDDEGGGFCEFVLELFAGWIRARRSAGAEAGETAAGLVALVEDDPYGLTDQIDRHIAPMLDPTERAALIATLGPRVNAAAVGGTARWGDLLRALHVAAGDVAAYVALTERTGLSAGDCQAIATMLAAGDRPGEALAWAERGLAVAPQRTYVGDDRGGLAHLRRDLLARLGRGDEAVASAWAGYREYPTESTYDELMRFAPAAERAAWLERAMEAASGAAIGPRMRILVHARQVSRLAALVAASGDEVLERVTHHALEPAAEALERSEPGEAARLWRAAGMRILKAAKSQYYQAALRDLERAQRCYQLGNRLADWQRVVDEVRSAHARKRSFLPGFERIVREARRGHSTA